MKKYLLLLVILIFSVTNIYSQTQPFNQFPFGVYVGYYHGIYGEYLTTVPTPRNDLLMDWKNSLGFNSYYVVVRGSANTSGDYYNGNWNQYGVGKEFIGQTNVLNNYFNSNNLNSPILANADLWDNVKPGKFLMKSDDQGRPGIGQIADGHYIYADKVSTAIPSDLNYGNYLLIGPRSNLIVDTIGVGKGFKIQNSNYYSLSNIPTFENLLQVTNNSRKNGFLLNDHIIRRRDYNFVNEGNFEVTKYKIEIDYDLIDLDNSTSIRSTSINIKISNQDKWDEINNNPLNFTFIANEGQVQKQVVPFDIKSKDLINNTVIWSGYHFGIKVDLTINSISSRTRLLVKALKIYDDLGKLVVEDNYFDDSYNQLIAGNQPKPLQFINYIHDTYINYSNINPVIHLSDESMIGNNAVMAKMINTLYTNSDLKNRLFVYTTTPEGVDLKLTKRLLEEFKNINNSYFSLDKLIIAPDPYLYKNETPAGNFSIYKTTLMERVDSDPNLNGFSINERLRDINTLSKNYSPSPKLLAVLQAHEYKSNPINPSDLRLPTYNEMIAQSYVSLINDYKGILYWSIYDDSKTNSFVYKKNTGSDDGYNWMDNLSNFESSNYNSMKRVSDVLNKQLSGENKVLGKFLLENKVESPGYISNNNNYSKIVNIGNSMNDVLLEKIEIIDPATGIVRNFTDEYLLGYATTVGTGGNRYFYLANLNMTPNKNIKVRLFFKSSNKNFVEVSVISDPNIIIDRVYPADAIVLLTIPGDDFMVVKVLATNIPTNLNSRGFPKGSNFGVVREENDSTKIILDKNFRSIGGQPEELWISEFGIGKQVVPVLYDNDALTDFAIMSYYFQSNALAKVSGNQTAKNLQAAAPPSGYNLNVSFKVYKQKSDGSGFYLPITVNYGPYNFSSSSYKVQPYCVDFTNNAIGKILGFAVIDNFSSNKNIQFYESGSYKKTVSNLTSILTNSNFKIQPFNYVITGTGKPVLSIYTNNNYYIDKNNDNDFLDANEVVPYFWSSATNYPIVGDWTNDFSSSANDANYEYGMLGNDNFYFSGFRLNFGGIDPYSYFEWNYGNIGDKPLIWKAGQPNQNQIQSNYEIETIKPKTFEFGVYPNPFNPQTNFKFKLPKSEFVVLEVYNMLGQKVQTLVNSNLESGEHFYSFNGSTFASGTYIYRMNVGNKVQTGKILLLK